MSSRRIASLFASTALLTLSALAPTASASSVHMAKAIHFVPLKACNAVMSPADFKDELEEVSSAPSPPGYETTTCKFAGLEADTVGPTRMFSEGQIGTECIANIFRLHEIGEAPPKGSCFRISTATLSVVRTRAVEKLIEKGIKEHHKFPARRGWPAGYTRRVLHNVGSRAEFGYDGEDGYGYLEVLNATLTIETTEPASLTILLRDGASLL